MSKLVPKVPLLLALFSDGVHKIGFLRNVENLILGVKQPAVESLVGLFSSHSVFSDGAVRRQTAQFLLRNLSNLIPRFLRKGREHVPVGVQRPASSLHTPMQHILRMLRTEQLSLRSLNQPLHLRRQCAQLLRPLPSKSKIIERKIQRLQNLPPIQHLPTIHRGTKSVLNFLQRKVDNAKLLGLRLGDFLLLRSNALLGLLFGLLFHLRRRFLRKLLHRLLCTLRNFRVALHRLRGQRRRRLLIQELLSFFRDFALQLCQLRQIRIRHWRLLLA
ncbi:MAG: hypothetical protein BWY63_00277 [Chloroflexi bacterium ADurb.Bin360]|nr:MAG: hypothetical protein BWY63_00277 [Chloroflexi bacterium ADurb.Bin360]